MAKRTFTVLVSMVFLLSCRTASANDTSLASLAGSSTVGFQFLKIAASSFPRYARGCLAAPTCRLLPSEATDLTAVLAYLDQHAGTPTMKLADDGTRLPDGDAVSAWSSPGSGELVVAKERLAAKDLSGRMEPLNIFRGTKEIAERLAEAASIKSGPTLAAKLALWLHDHAEMALLGTARSLVAIDLGVRDHVTDLYVADDTRVTTLTQAVWDAFRCADGSKPIGIRLWSGRWSHGKPGTIFLQPIDARMNIFCADGHDHLGDNALIEMKFSGETMTNDAPVISLLECSKGGCYPHRDPNQ